MSIACGTQVTFTQSNKFRSQDLKDQLAAPLWSSDKDHLCNVMFVCANGETVKWNGLAFLGSLSHVFKPLSGEEQSFTVLMPDYEAPLVRKLLILISMGSSMVRRHEAEELTRLANILGVSFKHSFNLFQVVRISFFLSLASNGQTRKHR